MASNNSSSIPDPSLQDQDTHQNILAGLGYGILGLVGLLLNVLVVPFLPKLSDLHPSTCILTFTQCCVNSFCLIPKTFFVPIVLFIGESPVSPSNIFHGVFGFPVVFGVFSSVLLQLLMAFQRYIGIGLHSMLDVIFSRRNTMIMVGIGLGLIVGIDLLVSFGLGYPLVYSSKFGQWTYFKMPAAKIQALSLLMFAIAMEVLTLLCYLSCFLKLETLRKMVHNHLVSQEQMRKEVRVLTQFGITGFIYMFYMLAFALLAFIPAMRSVRGSAAVAEVARYFLMMMDPLVYLILMKQLRVEIRNKFCGPHQVSGAP